MDCSVDKPEKKTVEQQQISKLVRQARAGQLDAQGELIKQFEPTVFAVVLRRLRNRTEASDVTQDVFIQALRKLPQLRDPERFPGWLRQIAVRMSINSAVRRAPESSYSPDSLQWLTSSPHSPLDDLLRDERKHQVRGGLDRLRALDRRTLVAFYYEGQSLKQMSDEFDSPIGTIKRRLHTARNRLREQLDRV